MKTIENAVNWCLDCFIFWHTILSIINVNLTQLTVPFHLRYQPASDDNRDEAEILVPSPQIQFIKSDGDLNLLSGDPFYITIPIGNKIYLPYVNYSTLLIVTGGSLYFLRALLT